MADAKLVRFKWRFIGLSSEDKPTPEDYVEVSDGVELYEVDTSTEYVYYNNQWYEKATSGGGGGGGSVVVDAALSATSRNPVQNKVIFAALQNKADASALSGKVSVAQGTENAGKFLIVGSDGNVAPVAMLAWQGGSY